MVKKKKIEISKTQILQVERRSMPGSMWEVQNSVPSCRTGCHVSPATRGSHWHSELSNQHAQHTHSSKTSKVHTALLTVGVKAADRT